MRTFKLELAMDGAAFDDGDNGMYELVSIIRDFKQLLQGYTVDGLAGESGQIRDHNGNKCGSWEFIDTEHD